MPAKSAHWFATVTARPIPELPDRVTVAVVFGNGKLEHLEVNDKLARLKGLVSEDHRRIMKHSLDFASSEISMFSTLKELNNALGIQFEVGDPRPLTQPYSRRVIQSISRAYLQPLQSHRTSESGLLRESLRQLDGEVDKVIPVGKAHYIRKQIDVDDLYPVLAERYQIDEIGPLKRVVVGDHRDVLLASVIVRDTERTAVDAIVLRAARQKYFLEALRGTIKTRALKDYRFVGVVQPMDSTATASTRALQQYYSRQWTNELDVCLTPRTIAEAAEQLAPHLEWAAST